jgi:hypothetical protein
MFEAGADAEVGFVVGGVPYQVSVGDDSFGVWQRRTRKTSGPLILSLSR